MKHFDWFAINTGDLVEYANGDIKVVLWGTEYGDILTSRDRRTYASIDEYDDEVYDGDHQYDIVKVMRPKNKFRCLSADYDGDYDVIWEKKCVLHITMNELRDMLGGDFVIVG